MITNRENQLSAYLEGQREEMIRFLADLVRLESPSHEPASQAPILALLAERLAPLGFVVRRLPGRQSGGMLFARPAQRTRGRPRQLLLGHCDTVWPLGTLATMPFEIDGNTMRGPGVFDMKAGLTMIVFALQALDALALQPALAPLVLINSDEEVGSPDSIATVRRLAQVVDRVFVLEPALGPRGQLKTARKGIMRFRVDIHGKAAHAGLDPGGGASAIVELSYVIQQLAALNDPDRGVSVNVGVVAGGLRPNVVAPHATAEVDVRVPTWVDAERVGGAILALRTQTPGTTVAVDALRSTPPLERTPRNQALWRLAEELGRELGLALEQGAAGGGSDGNTTSQHTATLDGLGAVGDGAHAPHEFIYLDRLVERCALLARLLLAPA